MNKNQIIEAFNNHFIEFITDVERVFPNDTDISLARKSISKSVVLLPKLLLKLFNEYFVVHYSKEIEEGNLDFFIENNYRNTYGYKQEDDAWIMAKIDCLRQPVKNMDNADKDKVIQYLKNLKKLSDLYISQKKTN
jgi:hypothetical protein